MKPESTSPVPFFKKTDALVLLALLLAAALLFFAVGKKPAGNVAVITVLQAGGGETVQIIPLHKNQILHIEKAALPVTLEIKDGAVRFVNSLCPDHVCQNTGWLRQEGDWAACIPAGVWVRIEASGG